METLGVGIIGFGFIGKVHAYGYQSIPLFYEPIPFRTKLIGVAEADEARAAAAAEQGGFEFGTADWRELIARDDIQIINVCSPNRCSPRSPRASTSTARSRWSSIRPTARAWGRRSRAIAASGR